jgi:hypothetical protein
MMTSQLPSADSVRQRIAECRIELAALKRLLRAIKAAQEAQEARQRREGFTPGKEVALAPI